jgi:septal ring factor EnvC (AmiA/AmiB activator)
VRTKALAIAAPLALAAALGGSAQAVTEDGPSRERLERLYMAETVLTAEQGRNLNQLARLLTMLMQFHRDPPPALLVSPDDAKAAVRGAILVKAMTPQLQAKAQAYAAQAREIARQRRLAAVASEALFTSDSERAELRAVDDGLISRADLGLRGPADPLERRQMPPGVPPDSLVPPAAGPFASVFGDTLPGGGKSNGVSIATAHAAPVHSPGAGRVEYVGPVKGWGVILILRLTGGYHLVLAGGRFACRGDARWSTIPVRALSGVKGAWRPGGSGPLAQATRGRTSPERAAFARAPGNAKCGVGRKGSLTAGV